MQPVEVRRLSREDRLSWPFGSLVAAAYERAKSQYDLAEAVEAVGDYYTGDVVIRARFPFVLPIKGAG